MKRNASEVAQSLRKKLIRLASTNPKARKRAFAALAKIDPRFAKRAEEEAEKDDSEEEAPAKEASKTAFAKVAGADTEDFVRWVLSTMAPMSEDEVEAFVSRTLRIKTSPPFKKAPGPRFKKGDKVIVCADKHKGPGKGTYQLYDNKVGTCVDADGNDLMLSFPGESEPVRFEDGMKPRGVGVYKYTAPYTIDGSAKFEMIYFAGNKPTNDAKVVVDAYVGRGGDKQKRSVNYYSGHAIGAATGSNGYYFKAIPQQRLSVSGKGCTPDGGEFQFRAFNPSLGQVFYIGVLSQRPPTWKKELEALDKQFDD